MESALLDMLPESRDSIVECIKKRYPETMQIMKFIGEFYDPPNENSVSDEYVEENWDEVRVPANVAMFFEWVDEGMPRRN